MQSKLENLHEQSHQWGEQISELIGEVKTFNASQEVINRVVNKTLDGLVDKTDNNERRITTMETLIQELARARHRG